MGVLVAVVVDGADVFRSCRKTPTRHIRKPRRHCFWCRCPCMFPRQSQHPKCRLLCHTPVSLPTHGRPRCLLPLKTLLPFLPLLTLLYAALQPPFTPYIEQFTIFLIPWQAFFTRIQRLTKRERTRCPGVRERNERGESRCAEDNGE